MRAVIQRVTQAQVEVDGVIVGRIKRGLLVLLGVSTEDTVQDADYIVDKIVNLRIFEDQQGKMNRCLLDVQGEMLVVSQFTLLADCRKGRRPSFVAAATPEKANDLYEYCVAQARRQGITVATGQFQALMEVSLINYGPVTLLVDSRKEL